MFYVTSRVGTKFAVYDDSDNTVEWHDSDSLNEYLKFGVEIKGYSINKDEIKLITNKVCAFDSCNWTKTKKNIFSVADKVATSKDSIIVFAEGKKYKCNILDRNNTVIDVLFTNGLNVSIPVDWLERW